MTLPNALKASPTGYAERFDPDRGVKVVRTKVRQYIEVQGRLVPATCFDDLRRQDWQPIRGVDDTAK